MSWAIAYSATVLAVAYAVPRLVAAWWQMAMVNAQIAELNSTGGSAEAQFDLSGAGPYP
jgi:hypothetical protein